MSLNASLSSITAQPSVCIFGADQYASSVRANSRNWISLQNSQSVYKALTRSAFFVPVFYGGCVEGAFRSAVLWAVRLILKPSAAKPFSLGRGGSQFPEDHANAYHAAVCHSDTYAHHNNQPHIRTLSDAHEDASRPSMGNVGRSYLSNREEIAR